MKRKRCGRLIGVNKTFANNVMLHWCRVTRRKPWVLAYLSWRGPHGPYRMSNEELAERFGMKRIANAAVNKPISHVCSLDGLKELPGLFDFLCATYYGDPADGDERLPGSIYICARDREFGITLKEPTQGLMCRLQVPSFKLIIPTIEALLSDEVNSHWETDPYARKPAKRQGKPKA